MALFTQTLRWGFPARETSQWIRSSLTRPVGITICDQTRRALMLVLTRLRQRQTSKGTHGQSTAIGMAHQSLTWARTRCCHRLLLWHGGALISRKSSRCRLALSGMTWRGWSVWRGLQKPHFSTGSVLSDAPAGLIGVSCAPCGPFATHYHGSWEPGWQKRCNERCPTCGRSNEDWSSPVLPPNSAW
jgi:hypothetical protein